MNTLPLQSKSGEISSPRHTEHLGKSKTHALHILAHIRQHLCTEQALLPELESAMRRKAKPWAVVLQ